MRPIHLAFIAAFAAGGAGCGQSLTTPEALPLRELAAGTKKITLVMKSCSDTCAEYDEPTCEATVDGNTITLDVCVTYSDKDGVDRDTLEGCSVRCGAPVLATCDVPTLARGTYTVVSGTFEETIEVQ